MNNEQRKYLLGVVNATYKKQVDALRSKMPTKPSLNNYLIAAFLDNSIQFADIERLKVKMRKSVIQMGKADHLVIDKKSGNWRTDADDDDVRSIVQVLVEDIFIIPQNYLDALNEYQIEKDKIERQIQDLGAIQTTIEMKIQIGSNKVLDTLVEQIDNMGDLNILNNKLILGDTTKELTDGKEK